MTRECISPQCTKKAVSKDFCDGHYQRYRKGQPTDTPLRHQAPTNSRQLWNEYDEKRCSGCGQYKPRSAYHHQYKNYGPLAKPVYKARCIPCASAVDKLARYGLTLETYNSMVEAQGDRCAICGTDDKHSDNVWFIDHDHTCCPGSRTCGNCVRALLCRNCNTGLGMFADRIDIMSQAINYLKEHSRG